MILNYPLVVFALAFILLWLAALLGAALGRKWRLEDDRRDDFGLVLGATLTLLGLIIGFTFSLAINRYDQRKNYEEAEANAIGTEYVRADLLPPPYATQVTGLLERYLDQRIAFYETRDDRELQQIDSATAGLQNELWLAVRAPASARPTPVNALVLSGMNDVLNSQGYTQAAWWNRIPTSAWALMILIAVCCNVLIGYSSRPSSRQAVLLLTLPLLGSVAFLLIADLDSPRRGLIHVQPQNLVSLADSLRVQQH
jgi:hypothetical protein